MSRRTSPGRPDSAELVRLLPAMGVLAVWTALMPAAGGFDPADWLPAGLVLVGLVILAAVGGGRLLPPARAARRALLALAAFTAWSLLSISWSAAPGDAWESANLLLVTLLAGWTLALVPWRPHTAVLGVLAFAVAASVVCALALADALRATQLDAFFTDQRFNQPLDYPNTSAAFCLIAGLPALLVAARPGAGLGVKAVAQAAGTFLVAFALLPQSRGSVLGGAVAVVVLLSVVPFRWRMLAGLAVAAVGVAIAARPVLHVYDVASAGGRVSAALEPAAWSLLAAALVGLLGGAGLGLAERRVRPGDDARRVTRVAGWALVALVVVGALGAAAANAGRISDAADKQWRSLKHPGVPFAGRQANRAGASRLATVDPLERYDYWRVAVDGFRAHPIRGIGIGTFGHAYTTQRRYPKPSKYPHNLTLRVLGETGIVGFVLWLAFLGFALAGLLGGLRRADRPERTLVAAALATAAYVAVHGSLDWLEAYPVITGPVLGLVLVTLVARDRAQRLAAIAAAVPSAAPLVPRASRLDVVPRPVAVGLAALACLAAAASLLAPWLSLRYEERGVGRWRTQPAAALADLRHARALNPLAATAPQAEGLIAVQLGRDARARAAFATALAREPYWVPHLELALLDAQAGRRRRARAELARATALSPRESVLGAARELLAGNDRVDAARATRKLFAQETPVRLR